MRQIKKVFRGIIALLFTACILLLSDLSNRKEQQEGKLAPDRKLKLCLAHYVDSPNSEDCEEGILKALKDNGLEENVHFTLQRFNAQGDISTLNSIAEAISSADWDLIFSTSTPTIQALSKKISNTHIVFTNVGDPIRAGLGESFKNHNPNMTGISTMSDFTGMVKLVKTIHPNLKRIGTVFTPAEVNSVAYMERLEDAAKVEGLELVTTPVNSATEVYDAAVSLSLKNIDAFTQISDNLTAGSSSSIIKVSQNSKIPYYAFVTKQIKQGAVAAAARDYFQAGYDAGVMGKRILIDGENPADIPYQFVTKTIYEFNQEAAGIYNITFPKEVLKLAEADKKIKLQPGKKLKLCLAHYVDSKPSEDCERGLRDALKEMGLEEGENFTLQVFCAQGDVSTLNSIAETISAAKWDLVFTTSTPTIQVMSKKVSSSPVVFANVADPVIAGIGESFEKHNPNVTGISTQGDFWKMVEIIKIIHPNVKKVGTIFTPGEVNSVSNKNNMEKACIESGLELIAVPANNSTDVYDAAVALSQKGIEVFGQIGDNLTATCGSSILKVARDHKIPYYGLVRDQLEMGAIAIAARDYYQAGIDVAAVGKQVLEGEKPAEIPFRLAAKTIVSYNQEAADFFGVQLPTEILKEMEKN